MARKVNREEIGFHTAFSFAIDAHENHFESRRGLWDIDGKFLCLYDNNPYVDCGDRRYKEIAAIQYGLVAIRVEVWAQASFPPPAAEDASYTYALIIGSTDYETVKEVIEGVLAKFAKEHASAPPPPPIGPRVVRLDLDAPPSPN